MRELTRFLAALSLVAIVGIGAWWFFTIYDAAYTGGADDEFDTPGGGDVPGEFDPTLAP